MKTAHDRHGWVLVAAMSLCAVAYPPQPAAADAGGFQKLSVYLERNLADHDAEIRFEATGTDDGLSALKISAPDERTVIDFRTPDSKLGIRSLILESPEPSDDALLRADFPAGAYRFEGTTIKGTSLRGEARLSHAFPKPAALEYPRPDQKDVPATALTLRWSVPNDIDSCTVVVEEAGTPYEIRAVLPGTAKSLTVPEGFLRAGQTYKVAIGTVAKDGNQSFIETSFVTGRAR